MSDDYDYDPGRTTDYVPPARRRAKARLMIALVAFPALAAAAAAPAALFVLKRVAAPTVGKSSAVETSAKDPYPECAAIRRWLRDHSGEPDRLEIISWGPRTVEEGLKPGQAGFGYRDPKGIVHVTVRYRGVNQFGAMQSKQHTFTFAPGVITLPP